MIQESREEGSCPSGESHNEVVKESQIIYKGHTKIEEESSTLADFNIFAGDTLWVRDLKIHEDRDIVVITFVSLIIGEVYDGDGILRNFVIAFLMGEWYRINCWVSSALTFVSIFP
ncbi:hypothetical protein BT93_E1029 [Corymbia citriodora subsp. variegata]|nr:hypothetical protein BT93_E1029 [Corymbia citriodora subsp. variegata]